tara:strand:- start:22 stop:1218 length:1197 start_codon:yes stop_codon:yes gene_type:complete
MKKDTLVVHTGRIPGANSGCVNTPVYRTSTILFPTMDDYYAAEKGKAFYETSKNIRVPDLCYATTGTPTSYVLQRSIAELEGAEHAVISPSGLSAITLTFMAFLKQGDHILVTDSAYGPSRRFCNKVLKQYGIETTYYDPTIGEGIKDLIQSNTKLIHTESPGSLTFEIQDIPAISKVAHNHGIVVTTDNSWATPLYCNPIELGADVSIQAATKYIGGHSDILLGTVAANQEHYDKIAKAHHHFGAATSPDDCYLALRGLRTMATRLERHEKHALSVAQWINERPEVDVVFHPGLESHPGHDLFKRDFKGSTGLFSFVLNEKYSYQDMCRMIDHFEIFGIGASWGGFESLVLHFSPSTIRTAKKWNYSGQAVRLYIGLEDLDDILYDLEKGFERLNNT